MRVCPKLGVGEWYHGTSSVALKNILSGTNKILPVFQPGANESLGGAYLTTDCGLAKVYADTAASSIGGSPIILIVKAIQRNLLPDEDLAAALTDFRNDPPESANLIAFVDALFESPDYFEGVSLSDIYRKHYEIMNKRFKITWRDSLKWINAVRQPMPLSIDQILSVLE